MEKLKPYVEFLNEMNLDRSKFLLASGKKWHPLWSDEMKVDGVAEITVIGGWTESGNDLFISVINVEVNPKWTEGAEDKAAESITVYFKEWSTREEAIRDVQSRNSKIVRK